MRAVRTRRTQRRIQSRVDLDRHHKGMAAPLLLPPRRSLDPGSSDQACSCRLPLQGLSKGAPTPHRCSSPVLHRPSPLRLPRPHRRASGAPRRATLASMAISPALDSAAPWSFDRRHRHQLRRHRRPSLMLFRKQTGSPPQSQEAKEGRQLVLRQQMQKENTTALGG